MMKSIKAQEGFPISEFLDNPKKHIGISTGKKSETDLQNESSQDLILMALRSSCNKGTCISSRQGEYIATIIRSLIPEASKSNTNSYLQVLPLATYINSIRLECENCLNTSCDSHETNEPIAETEGN